MIATTTLKKPYALQPSGADLKALLLLEGMCFAQPVLLEDQYNRGPGHLLIREMLLSMVPQGHLRDLPEQHAGSLLWDIVYNGTEPLLLQVPCLQHLHHLSN